MTTQRPNLEDVFKTNGVPTYTFVRPQKYTDILVNLRTAGRSLVVEGPSGIGKTTAMRTAIKDSGITGQVADLSARKPSDVEIIQMLPDTKNAGIIMIDDFHKLDHAIQSKLADHIKYLADVEEKGTKIVILGINRAGDSLIKFAPDLINRLDIVRFEAEPDTKIDQLIKAGQVALNISFNVVDDIVKTANGSFYLAQMLCSEMCKAANILERSSDLLPVSISLEGVKASVWDRLDLKYHGRCQKFCTGTRLRTDGRAPYLHILQWLATEANWTLDIGEAVRRHGELKGSVGQIVDKGYLSELISADADIREVLHFNGESRLLTVEDPQFLFYLQNLPWHDFATKLGFKTVDFPRRYDFALSFAGEDRQYAETIFDGLSQEEVEVFYDKNEQDRILAEDVEEYLRPIYQSEAEFVIAILGREYPKKVWTRFESGAFKGRFKEGSVIPVWFKDVDYSTFDVSRGKGGFTLDPTEAKEPQIAEFVKIACAKLTERRRGH
mgnify:CR=1 FL=1